VAIAHRGDFNNVLTVIQSYTIFVEESLDPADARREDVVEIRRAAERATKITDQLLTVSRHCIAAPRSIKIDEIVKGFEPMLRRLVGERVNLVTHRVRVPDVVADPGQFGGRDHPRRPERPVRRARGDRHGYRGLLACVAERAVRRGRRRRVRGLFSHRRDCARVRKAPAVLPFFHASSCSSISASGDSVSISPVACAVG
jgi:signal transduction histidine kinase